jgi:hypothetical protein
VKINICKKIRERIDEYTKWQLIQIDKHDRREMIVLLIVGLFISLATLAIVFMRHAQ